MPSLAKQIRQDVEVINDSMLIEGIKFKKSDNSNEDPSLVDLAPTSETLTLSFKSIGKIENLVGFDNLTKLCIDNNLIEEITNLDHLVNLRWLDLSFNKIKKIEGLSKLLNLEDLSLFSNKISVVEGLDNLKKLQCLSLGNNKIDSLDQIIRIRQIPNIKMLTLSGNPICNDPEYKMTVLAYVSKLKYLDYSLIENTDILNAKEQFHDELIDLEEKESVIIEKVNREKAADDYIAQLMEASILFSHVLFDDMFNEDTEIEKLKHLPGVKDTIDSFRASFKTYSDEFIKNALERYERKKINIQQFELAVKKIREKDDYDSTLLIENFNKLKKSVITLIEEDGHERHSSLKKLTDELDSTCDELFSIEVRQVEKFDSLIDNFDNNLIEMKTIAFEAQQLFFRVVEDLEDKFSNAVKNVAIDLIDRLAREELAEDFLDDEAMGIVSDKDTCMGIISSSHDIHIGKILKKEDEARATENRKYQDLMNKLTTEERNRNRDHILQIHDFNRESKHQINDLFSIDEEEGDDEN